MPWLIRNLKRLCEARWLIATAAAVTTLYAILFRTKVSAPHLASVSREMQELRTQLARVENAVKDLIQELERKRLEENATKEQAEEARSREQETLKSLQRAIDAYDEVIQSIIGLWP